VLCAVAALAGCGTDSDAAAIRALTDRFMTVMAPGDAAAGIDDLRAIFTGMDESAAPAMTRRLALLPRFLRYTAPAVRFLLFGGAAVTIDLQGGPTEGTIVLRARKSGGEWRFDPSFHVTQRLGEVRAPAP
jgi:hypothetical protein